MVVQSLKREISIMECSTFYPVISQKQEQCFFFLKRRNDNFCFVMKGQYCAVHLMSSQVIWSIDSDITLHLDLQNC